MIKIKLTLPKRKKKTQWTERVSQSTWRSRFDELGKLIILYFHNKSNNIYYAFYYYEIFSRNNEIMNS